MNVYELKDKKSTLEIVQEYAPAIKNGHTPLIIDNGSYQCRVGWATQMKPSLIFRNLIAKPRKDRVKKDAELPINPPTQIGNDIVNIEALRFQLKTQFDRNVVTHYHIQEQVFDYIFTHLSIDTDESVEHPIVMTECFVNPNYCRNLMSELLFECYGVPAVCYGVDSLYSYKYNKLGENGLIVSCGYHSTHILPILNGQIVADKCRRINLGGFHMITYLHRLLQLKYPVHVNAITLSRVEELLHEHSSITYDYMSALVEWASIEFYEDNVRKIQLPFTQPTVAAVLTAEQKFEKKRELAKRLTEINARKRGEKLADDEELLQKLYTIRELFDDGDLKEFKLALREQELSSADELKKTILNVRARIDKTRQKMATADVSVIMEEKVPQIPKPPSSDMTTGEWVAQVKSKRSVILERKLARRQRKQDLAKRRTAAAQERMRIISHLAKKEKGTDDFGMRDEDWDIYKAISREGGDSDSEMENEKLLEFDEVLRHHDPNFEDPNAIHGAAGESHQLHVGVESIRPPELLFQPSMIGSQEAGLVETIDFILKSFDVTDQQTLVDNIFLTGGCAKFPGLKERFSREMTEIRPFQTSHRIRIAGNASLDAWLGAREFATPDNLKKYQVTKDDYVEYGGEYLKVHYASNNYYKTPISRDNHNNLSSSSIVGMDV